MCSDLLICIIIIKILANSTLKYRLKTLQKYVWCKNNYHQAACYYACDGGDIYSCSQACYYGNNLDSCQKLIDSVEQDIDSDDDGIPTKLEMKLGLDSQYAESDAVKNCALEIDPWTNCSLAWDEDKNIVNNICYNNPKNQAACNYASRLTTTAAPITTTPKITTKG